MDDLDLDVDDGELLVILGPSGSGKTTLLRCIAGLERADGGEIVVDGRVVYSSERRLWLPPERRGISMVFQSYALWPHMTAYENVAYPLRSRRLARSTIRERVVSALTLVGCAALERRHPSELSGGQQQRIAVARAIVAGNRVVLFDEPLSSVDARVREELRRELVALQRELGFSAVYITHDQTEAMAIGHRVAVLADGKIMQIAAPRDLYGRPASGYVAEFMGATNRFPGTIETRTPSGVKVNTPLGTMAAADAADISPGAAVAIFFRPEHCRIDARPLGDTVNSWQCEVIRSLFLGFCTEYLLKVNDLTLAARSSDDQILADGSTAWLSIAASDVRVVSA